MVRSLSKNGEEVLFSTKRGNLRWWHVLRIGKKGKLESKEEADKLTREGKKKR